MGHASTISPVEEVAAFFAQAPSRDEIARFQLSEVAQEQIADLLNKEDGGILRADEKRQLDELMILNDLVALIRSHVPEQLSGSAQ